jgi:hypothetical protein
MTPEKVAAILDGTYTAKFQPQGILPTTPIAHVSENAKLARAVSRLFQPPTASCPAIPLHSMQLLPMF